ncbi:MAG TPA: carotenoid oxygenase family protein [Microthrixaceae bacterium]|nr:carotenoid oxygenase family protein [Microthrixaceae bacterium]HNH38159.1 carotenoid oxygenase family protein [Microthrixaceae bacterium]
MHRRKLLTALGLGGAAIGAGALSACGGGSDDASGAPGRAAGAAAGGAGATSTTAPTPTVAPTPYDPSRPYWVQGNFAPVAAEETVTELAVTGEIPAELTGLFVRNGSNPATGEALHWFLGDGMVHGVRLDGGKALWYRNRYVTTPLQQSGKGLMEFGGVPGQQNNQSNVAVVEHGGRFLSLGEVGWPYEMSTEDLSTVGPFDYAGKLGPTMTAHPKVDPETGRMHFFGYEFMRPALTYYAADSDGTLDVVSPITVPATTMIHDFAVTDRDAVFWIGPVVFGPDPTGTSQIPFHWDPTGPSRIGVMPLDGSGADIRWVDVPPSFAFHGYNAHRDGDDVVLRVHRADEAFGPKGDLVSTLLTEWRIGTAGPSLTFTEEQISDRPMDLPSHDRRRTGRETRHGWFVTTTSPDSEYGFELEGICHLDLRTGKEDVWDPGPHRRGGEPFFVGADSSRPDGDGWVLTYVWDRTTDRSSLAVFDAQDVASGPVGEVQLPVRVPFGFHGTWIPA